MSAVPADVRAAARALALACGRAREAHFAARDALDKNGDPIHPKGGAGYRGHCLRLRHLWEIVEDVERHLRAYDVATAQVVVTAVEPEPTINPTDTGESEPNDP